MSKLEGKVKEAQAVTYLKTFERLLPWLVEGTKFSTSRDKS